jgi:signal transduction histidine kinase
MHRLPPLVVGACRWVLPMADASSAMLAECLLYGDRAEANAPLIAALAADPPLVLWAVCGAERQDGSCPENIAQILQWLSRNAASVLRWDAPQVCPATSPLLPGEAVEVRAPDGTNPGDLFAELTFSSLYAGELSAQLVREQGPHAVERARLLGLLHNARQWLALAGASEADELCCLPSCVAEIEKGATPIAAAVRLAVGVVAGDASLPAEAPVDLEACRQRAVEGRQRWLMPIGGTADWLPLLARRLARLGKLEQEFQQAVETEKLEAMAEFAAGAGHEINNPLTVIAGRAQLLLQRETDPERRRGLALVSAQAMRAYEMIADMRLFARPPQPEFQQVNLMALVDRFLGDFAARAAQQETAIVRRGPDEPLEIEADPTQLTVALGALCQNALEALGHGGQIEIAMRPKGADVEIAVTDDGPGILPEERRHLFDPFYSARQAGRGLGMGLSKCWRIVTQHGGCIDVESQAGQGVVFTITLPVRHSPPNGD